MKKVIVCFNASDVAAIAGRHPFRSRGEALFKCILSQKAVGFSEIQRAILKDPQLCNVAIQKEKGNLLAQCPSVQQAVEKSGNACPHQIRKEVDLIERTSKSNVVELRKCLKAVTESPEAVLSEALAQKYKAQVHETQANTLHSEYQNIRKAASRSSVKNFKEISQRFHQHCKKERLKAAATLASKNAEAAKEREKMLRSVRDGQMSTASAVASFTTQTHSERNCIQTAQKIKMDADIKTQSDVQSVAACIRGTLMEKQVIKTELPADKILKGEEQKSKYLRGSGYIVCGRVDVAMKDGRIEEIKTRKKLYSRAPKYDIIQLQVYLKMYQVPEGDLIEVSQDDKTIKQKTTVIQFSDDEWKVLDIALKKAAEEVRGANLEIVRSWLASPVAVGLCDFS